MDKKAMKAIDPGLRNQVVLDRQFLHTHRRLVERYGMMISRSLYDRMCEYIRSGEAKGGNLYRRNSRYRAYVVRMMNRKIAVSWDLLYESIASALPPRIIPAIEISYERHKKDLPPGEPIASPLLLCPICSSKYAIVKRTGLCTDCHTAVMILKRRPDLIDAYRHFVETNLMHGENLTPSSASIEDELRVL